MIFQSILQGSSFEHSTRTSFVTWWYNHLAGKFILNKRYSLVCNYFNKVVCETGILACVDVSINIISHQFREVPSGNNTKTDLCSPERWILDREIIAW